MHDTKVPSPTSEAAADMPAEGSAGDGLRWLVLTHQLPAKPAYMRVKVHRRLERIGAVALKNSVYVLPVTDDTLEDFQWLKGEIESGGGESTLAVAVFLDAETDDRLKAAFREARASDYRELVEAAERATEELRRDGVPKALAVSQANKLRARLAAIRAIDFFDAPELRRTEQAVEALESLTQPLEKRPPTGRPAVAPGRTWVTRAGVKVDRIACAWLIRGFIDPLAAFKFVPAQGYHPREGEIRFDMFDGEFTHVGDSCTFETLLAHFELDEPALVAIGEIVHDVDIKDEHFGRPETAGVASLIHGIARSTSDDLERIRLGGTVFEGLYRSLG